MKICTKCGKEQDIEFFYKDLHKKDGRRNECIACNLLGKKLHYKRNTAKVLARVRMYADNNAHRIRLYRKKNAATLGTKKKAYDKLRRPIVNKKRKIRLNNDPSYRLSCNLRSRLKGAIKGNYKSGSAVRDLGCSIEELKLHLESQFKPGMSWSNYGFCGWHIDHIKPLASFDLTDRQQLLEACNYTNLQPLWAKDNFAKHSK